MITDEVLYNRYHSGDQNAADELVKRHADALTIYYISLRMYPGFS